MFRRNGKKGNYAYTVARVKAKKAHLLGEEDYNKMLMMTVPEISRYISETVCPKEMADLAGRYEGIELLLRASFTNMAKVYNSILQASEGELRDMVSAYLTKWDIGNLKVILRGKSYGLDADGIRANLVPTGSLSAESLDKLISFDSEDEILATFGRMAHVSFPADVLAAYKATGNRGAIEDYLDKQHYAKLIESINTSSRPGRLFLDYIRKEIDVKNLETILKLKVEGIHGDIVMNYYIPGGKQIDIKLATQLANAETIDSAVSELSQLDSYEDIKDALEAGNQTLRGVVAGMNAFEMRQAKKFSHLYPLSVIPVLDYMIHKENETDNIRLIARGTESGLDRDVIKGLLVI